MRITALMVGAALVAFSAPASAQVVGGLGGHVGGGVSIGPGNLGARDTLGGARDLTRDTVRGARDAARDSRISASARAEADASAGRDGVSLDLEAHVGADVRSRDGDRLGSMVGLARDRAGQAHDVLIQGADGAVRAVSASDLSADASGALTADLTAYQFRRRPEQRGQSDRTDRGQRETNDTQLY